MCSLKVLAMILSAFLVHTENSVWDSEKLRGYRLIISQANLSPDLVNYLATVTAKLRWDDASDLPQTRVSHQEHMAY
jgi:hypothetical protein